LIYQAPTHALAGLRIIRFPNRFPADALDTLHWLTWRECQLDSNDGGAADERETMRLAWSN